MKEAIDVKEENGLGNFTMIPDVITKIGLTPHQGWLYLHIKAMVHDNNGRTCRKSVRTLAKESSMSIPMIVKTKRNLAELNLISIRQTKSKAGDRSVDEITIKNLWPKNVQYFSSMGCSSNEQVFAKEKQDVKGSEVDRGCSPIEHGVKPGEHGVHHVEHRDSIFRDSIFRESKRGEIKEDAPIGAPIPSEPILQTEQKPNEWGPCLAAMAKVCATDLSIPQNAARLGKALKGVQKSKAAIVTPELIRHMYGEDNVPPSWWRLNHWKGKMGDRPTPNDIINTWGTWPKNGKMLDACDQVMAELVSQDELAEMMKHANL